MKVKLCEVCKYDGGFHYPDDGGEPFRPHHGDVNAAAEADEALAVSQAANKTAFRRAYQIIADEAKTSGHVSGNTVREQMLHAGISREDGNANVIGAAFRMAFEEGLLEPDGMVRSTDPGTHGHRITNWRSRTYLVDRMTA